MPTKSESRLTLAIHELRRRGLTDQEIAGLLTLKLLYANGHYRDQTPEQNQLEFVRWMYRNRRLSS